MNQNRKKQGLVRKKSNEKKKGSDYRLFIVLGVAIVLALIMGYAVMLTSR
jgi:flagellar basal body-associated protein FliL